MSVAVTHDLATCLEIRRVVFIEEQNVPEDLERDDDDAAAAHFLAQVDGTPVGTARIVTKGQDAKIGRVAVLKEARGTRQGQALIGACVDWAKQQGLQRAILGAQVDALGFYEKLGFTAYGDVFDDAGIDHKMMELRLQD